MLVAAIALCAAAYAKPIAYPLVAVMFVYVLFRMGWRRAGAFLVVCAALLAPWHVRNARVSNYRGFSTLGAHAVYVAAGGSVVARQEKTAYADARRQRWAHSTAMARREGYGWMWREGVALVASDPLGYARTHAAGMARTLFDPGAVEYLRLFGLYPESGGALLRMVDRGIINGAIELARTFPSVVWSSLAMGLALLPLVILSLFAVRRALLCACIVAWLAVASGGPPGSSRFRAPMAPFLIVMSAVALRSRPEDARGVRGDGVEERADVRGGGFAGVAMPAVGGAVGPVERPHAFGG